MPNLVPCVDCGNPVSPNAASCPRCGRPVPKGGFSATFYIVAVIAGLIVLAMAIMESA